ncbi:uncharacterized protein LY79DRAFT_580188 [Colletotrichum navitas]|uniref:HpcH/HpaI aldolase/citrate lyase domain-containing protein n=1 Tax=Colletotrichum navitas TaxID=681940 RepID=A0AAD8V5I0_9PEZI|nr:uncharacterized protein LY79DRAFT_580188 [Colletotrichum navitas]KAK1590253.1 hypothetical protein LY79DRAFT_580188 [Colletotrichum navitas]
MSMANVNPMWSLSSVLLMIEVRESVENIDGITSVKTADVLLIGSNNLTIDLEVPSRFESPALREATEVTSQAFKKHGRIMGLASIYDNHKLHDWAIEKLGAHFFLGG